MYKKTQGFKKSERIKRRTIFRDLFKKGGYFRSSYFSLRFLPNDINMIRLGISITKRIFRKATERNKVKRLIREVFRRNKDGLRAGYDILIRPKAPELVNSAYREAEKEMLSLFKKAGLLKQL